MHRIISIFVSLIFLSVTISSAQISADDLAKLDGMLEGYVAALSPEDVDTKNAEVDFIIETSRDSALRDHIAAKLFSYYSEAPIMGDEAVAVHIYDRWFANGQARFADRAEAGKALMFTQFNRSTMLGCEAPELHMRGLGDEDVTIPNQNGRSLVFFYDVNCSKCRLETILLRNFLRDAGENLTFYAVYVGDDREVWKNYCEEQFKILSDHVKIIHVWDPESVSEFQYQYGVTGTPRMFLIDDGVVVGRRLDTESLMQLISARKIQEELDSRAPVGSEIANLNLPGIIVSRGREKNGEWKLRSVDRVVFYVPGCANCGQTLEQVRKSSASVKGKTLLVDMDELSYIDKELSQTVFDAFDLTVLPYTIVLKHGRIVEKIR